jgi:hypothetical protein
MPYVVLGHMLFERCANQHGLRIAEIFNY